MKIPTQLTFGFIKNQKQLPLKHKKLLNSIERTLYLFVSGFLIPTFLGFFFNQLLGVFYLKHPFFFIFDSALR